MLLYILQFASTVLSDYKVEVTYTVEQNSATMVSGEQFAIVPGTTLMPLWFVHNLDLIPRVIHWFILSAWIM